VVALRHHIVHSGRIHASGAVKNWSNGYEKNTNGWCNGTTPCSGDETGFGTIDRVPSHFSNYGNYGDFVKSFAGGYHAVVSGTSSLAAGGCPSTTVEYCTGPFGLVNGTGSDSIFPTQGVTVSSQIYLDTAFVTQYFAGSPSVVTPEFDWDVSLNDSSGNFLQDFIAAACFAQASSDGFSISFGNSSPGACSGTPATVTKSGWYDFKTIFKDVSGDGVVEWQIVRDSTNTIVATDTAPITGPSGSTPLPVSSLGGPNYIWFPTEDVQGLPLDNTSVELGVHTTG